MPLSKLQRSTFHFVRHLLVCFPTQLVLTVQMLVLRLRMVDGKMKVNFKSSFSLAEAFAKAGKKKSLDEIEAELLGGQKLQGTLTAKEVNHVLKMKGLEHEFPFFTAVYKISYEDTPLEAICTTPY